MNDNPQQRPSDAILDEAAAWFVRLDGGALSDTEHAAFSAWLSADARHRRAFRRIERTWRTFDGVPSFAAPEVSVPERTGALRKPALRWAAFAAAAAIAALVSGRDLPVRLQADAMAPADAVETVALADGSRAYLNAGSALAFEFTGTERRIRLLRGEAEFEVEENPARPFTVVAAGGSATALGTVFSVRLGDGVSTVTVREGRVSVAGADDATGDALILGAGQQVAFSADEGPGPLTPVDADAFNAWRRGKLVFEGRPLEDVAAELSRYMPGTVRIVGDDLQSLTVNGVFSTADPIAAVDALEMSLGLSSVRIGDYLVLLYR